MSGTAAAGRTARPACATLASRPNSGLIYPMEAERAGLHQSVSRAAEGVDGTSGEAEERHSQVGQSGRADVGHPGSAESKQLDNQGLEAGLSYIGLVLENGERLISEYWSAYESIDPQGRQVATIKYPDRYSLKTDDDRITEVEQALEADEQVPGHDGEARDRPSDRPITVGRQGFDDGHQSDQR